MVATQKTYLNFIGFSELESWSSYSLLGKNLIYTNKYPFVKIGAFLKRNKTQVKIEDEIVYKRPTIRINGQGITLRDEVLGKVIGTKNQFRIKSKQFLLSKIARPPPHVPIHFLPIESILIQLFRISFVGIPEL